MFWVLVLWWFGCWCGGRVSGVVGARLFGLFRLLVWQLLGLWGVV